MKLIFHVVILFIALSFQSGCSKEETPYVESSVPSCQRTKLENQHIVHWKNFSITLERLDPQQFNHFSKKNRLEIEFIEPNYFIAKSSAAFATKSEDLAFIRPASTVHDMIYTPYLWQRGFQGQGIVIAIIDTGINLNHPQLINRLEIHPIESQYGKNGIDDDNNGYIDDIFGWNFVSQQSETTDEHGHGTAMAGIITGTGRTRPSLSMAPKARILPVDFMNETGGTEFHAQQAIAYAISRKANIINNSWSINCSELLKTAFLSWQNENIIFVNASGNSPVDVVLNNIVPSSLELPNILNVGSLDETGHRSSFSGFGSTVKVFAPGEFIPTIYPSSGLNQSTPTSGTSVSTAVVAGAAAVLWSAFPQATAAQIIQLLVEGANQEPFSERALNLKKAYILGNDLFYPHTY